MTIYEPAEDSYLLADAVKKYAKGKVLDIGTGSGIQAKTAASLKKVKSVLAVDINSAAVVSLNRKIQKENLKKIKAVRGDLFSTVKGKFDTIIFNPPYLPLDEREPRDSRLATTGGKHGYEVLERFIANLNDCLALHGIALIVFSSLTNKKKIDELLSSYGFSFEEIAEQKISFESLFVYKIKRDWLLEQLFAKKVTHIVPFMKGHRGMILTGIYKKKKVAIKAQRPDVDVETIEFEADAIVKLNKHGIAPKLFFKGKRCFAYEFINGEVIIDFLEHGKKQETKKVLLEVLRQCRALDKLNISKEEMHNPYKHVLIGKKIVLVDFERAHYDEYPHNITQFCQYVMRNHDVLSKKGIRVDKTALINAAQMYKKNQTELLYKQIQKLIAP